MKNETVLVICLVVIVSLVGAALQGGMVLSIGSFLMNDLLSFSPDRQPAKNDGTPQTSGDYQYIVSAEKAVIIHYWGDEEEVAVPNTLDGYPVVGIGARSFMSRTKVVSVTLPETVLHIDEEAFLSCLSLESIRLPDGLLAVREDAFESCSALRYNEKGNYRYLGNENNPYLLLVKGMDDQAARIQIEDSTRIVGPSAFEGFKRIESVSLPSGTVFISTSAFAKCTALKSIVIPSAVASIEARCFEGCTALTEVTLPASLSVIKQSAFDGCTALTEITLPASLTTIGTTAFARTGLTAVSIPDSVSTLGDCAFLECRNLKSVEIGKKSRLKRISDSAFNFCGTIERFFVPASVTVIGNYAFDNTYVKELVFDPETKLRQVQKYAFGRVDRIYFGSVSQWASVTVAENNASFKNAERYYYSQSAPAEEGFYWHYGPNGVILPW